MKCKIKLVYRKDNGEWVEEIREFKTKRAARRWLRSWGLFWHKGVSHKEFQEVWENYPLGTEPSEERDKWGGIFKRDKTFSKKKTTKKRKGGVK